jgi:hypothetical protein
MPAMPRSKGKATKIAWAILGEPLAMKQKKRDYRKDKVEKQLVFEETTRVR